MNKKILSVFLSILLVSCSTQMVRLDTEKMKSIKKVAVVVFTMKAKIVYRDDPKENDSDLGAWAANSSAFGIGENAANLAFPAFLQELNKQNLPFQVMTLTEMKANAAYMALQPPPPKDTISDKAKIAALSAVSTNKTGTGPTGFVHFGLPKKWRADGTALVGGKEEAQYIQKAISALGVDAAIVIVDRGASFQCRLACVLGNGDSTMGGAFNSALVDKNGTVILGINNWFQGKAHAVMARYVVNPAQRKKLYTQHGVRLAQTFAETYHEYTQKK